MQFKLRVIQTDVYKKDFIIEAKSLEAAITELEKELHDHPVDSF